MIGGADSAPPPHPIGLTNCFTSKTFVVMKKRFCQIQECERKIGSVAKQKEKDLEHLNRLLEGLQLDKDILTQLKVRKSTFLSLFWTSQFSPSREILHSFWTNQLSPGESAGKGGEEIGREEKMTESDFNIIYSNWHIKQDLKLHK